MIVEPNFLDHPKTLQLEVQLEDQLAPIYVLRLWSFCQLQRQCVFQKLTPRMLKAVCRYAGEPDTLFEAMEECGFIIVDGPQVIVHEWDLYNAKLVRNWKNGAKGGRQPEPKKPVGLTQTEPKEAVGLTQEEPKRPVGLTQTEPKEAVGLTDKRREEKRREEDTPFSPPLEGDVVAFFEEKGGSQLQAEEFWEYFQDVGWTVKAGNKRRPMTSWRRAAVGWLRREKERPTPWAAGEAEAGGGTFQSWLEDCVIGR